MIKDTDTKDERGTPGAPDAEKASEWKARITRMKKYAEKNQKNWERNNLLLFGQDGDEKEVKPNEFAFGWALVKSLKAKIYINNPEMMVEPYGDNIGTTLGSLLTNISNYDLDQMNIKAIGNLGLIDNFTTGFFACIEVIETDKDEVGEGDDKEMVVRDQRFAARRIASKDFLVDPQWKGLIDLSAARYIAVATYPIIAEMKANKELYKNLPEDIDQFPECMPDKRQSRQRYPDAADNRAANLGETDPAYKTICVWECWDKIKQKVIYVTDHKMIEIGEMDWPVKFRVGARSLFPVTLMAFHPMADAWPKAEIDLIAPQLKRLNELDRVIYQDALTKWRKFVTLCGLLSADQSAKVVDMSGPNSILTVDMEGLEQIASLAGTGPKALPNIRDIITPLADPQVKQDMILTREMCKQEIMDILGYGPPERGGMPKVRTAREAIAVKENIAEPISVLMDAVEQFYRDFGQKHLMALQQVMEVKRYARVFPAVSTLPATFQAYAKDDIEDALFNFIVFAGTSGPRNTEAKRSMEMQIFQTMMPFVQQGLVPYQPVILRFANAMQWKDVDALLNNPEQAMKQLAMVLAALTINPNVPPNALPEAAAAAVQAAVPPQKLAMWAKEFAGESQAGGPPPKKVAGQRGESDASKAQFQ